MKHAAMFFLVTLLTGCSVFPESTPAQLYRLPAPSFDASLAPSQQQVVEIQAPTATRLLASDRIVVWPDDQEVSVYADSRWFDNAPVMLQHQWKEALIATGIAQTAGPNEPHIDVRLATELRDFHIAYLDGTPTAIMQLQVTLFDATSGQRLASEQLSSRQEAASGDIPAAVMALGNASEQVAREMMRWLARQLTHSQSR